MKGFEFCVYRCGYIIVSGKGGRISEGASDLDHDYMRSRESSVGELRDASASQELWRLPVFRCGGAGLSADA